MWPKRKVPFSLRWSIEKGKPGIGVSSPPVAFVGHLVFTPRFFFPSFVSFKVGTQVTSRSSRFRISFAKARSLSSVLRRREWWTDLDRIGGFCSAAAHVVLRCLSASSAHRLGDSDTSFRTYLVPYLWTNRNVLIICKALSHYYIIWSQRKPARSLVLFVCIPSKFYRIFREVPSVILGFRPYIAGPDHWRINVSWMRIKSGNYYLDFVLDCGLMFEM